MGGLSIKPDISLDECTFESKDLLILPGGNTWREEIHQPILKKIGEVFKSLALLLLQFVVQLWDLRIWDS